MRKIMTFFILLITCFCISSVNPSHAYMYPEHLNGDSNYVLTYGHMNYGTYIEKSSVQVVAEDLESVVFSVNTVSGLVLERDDTWIFPARDIDRNSLQIMRRYKDAWNVIYSYDKTNGTWIKQDLSDTSGANQWFLGIVAESWIVLTGSAYPHLQR